MISQKMINKIKKEPQDIITLITLQHGNTTVTQTKMEMFYNQDKSKVKPFLTDEIIKLKSYLSTYDYGTSYATEIIYGYGGISVIVDDDYYTNYKIESTFDTYQEMIDFISGKYSGLFRIGSKLYTTTPYPTQEDVEKFNEDIEELEKHNVKVEVIKPLRITNND